MYAYAPNGVVADLCEDVPDFHPALAEQYRAVPSNIADKIALGWTVSGSSYAPPAPEPTASAPVPNISSAQAKIQLARAKFLPVVKETVAAMGGEVEIWFTDARTWQRDNPYVNEIGAGLNLTSAEIDDLFREAAQIAA